MTPPVYYNEIEPSAAAWLRELCREGLIPAGEIDTRSIEDIRSNDLKPFRQCHFFAGIGGWAYALRLAGWPDDREVWTGSCPCQPFSTAGKGGGFADERHLWPAWFHLVSECRPAVIFGEQVASKDADPWIDLVQDDLEGLGYAFGAVPFPAAGVGAPHIRDRLYWVADTEHSGREARQPHRCRSGAALPSGAFGGLADLRGAGFGAGGKGLASLGHRAPARADRSPGAHGPTSPLHGHWRDADWLFCRDGKWRPVEPGLQPLAHGVPARVGRLRGYGNAIVPQVAVEMISAYMDHAGILEQLG